MTKDNIQYMIESITKDIILLLMNYFDPLQE